MVSLSNSSNVSSRSLVLLRLFAEMSLLVGGDDRAIFGGVHLAISVHRIQVPENHQRAIVVIFRHLYLVNVRRVIGHKSGAG